VLTDVNVFMADEYFLTRLRSGKTCKVSRSEIRAHAREITAAVIRDPTLMDYFSVEDQKEVRKMMKKVLVDAELL